MTTRLTDKAVSSLIAYLEATYPSFLRLTETELELASGSLPNPVDYVPADMPADNRNPRIDVFEESWSLEDDHDSLYARIECAVVWSYWGDANAEAGELLARRCHTALVRCLDNDRSLGKRVVGVYFGNGSSASGEEENTSHHIVKQNISVITHETF